MVKRIVSLLLALAMVLVCATGAVAAEEPQSITIFGLPATVPESDPIIPVIEEAIGVDITMESTAGDESLLISRIAGGNIPDVFRVSNISNLRSYYDQEVLLDIKPYMDKMPHLYSLFTEQEWARVTIDGGIYGIPRRGEENYNCWYIRYDWLDKLGMEDPKTFDDLLNIAIAMKDSDLDGNGTNDTYAVSGTFDSTYGRSAFDGFYTAYGCTSPATIMIKDGKAVMSCTTDEFRLALKEIRRFVEAGVVDPEIVSNTNSTMIEKMATGKTGIAYGGWANYNKPSQVESLTAVFPDASWGPMRVEIATEYGISGASKSSCGYDAVYSINADLAKDPDKLEAVLKFFDYIATEEGDTLLSFGIEGVHYKRDADGTIVKLDAMDELSYGYAIQLTGRKDMEYCMTKFALCADYIKYCANDIPVYYHYGELVGQPEGINVADIKSYVLSEMTKFIFGIRSMDEYDQFIDTLRSSYQLETYLDVATQKLTELGYIQ